MILFKICIGLLYVHLTYSSDICKSENACRCELSSGMGVIDLSIVGSPEFPWFYDVLFEDNCSLKLYSYNPCYPFDSSDKHTKTDSDLKPCAGAAGCTKTPGGSKGEFPEEHAIGLQDKSVFGLNNGIDMYINYTVPGTAKILQVYLTCDDNSTEHLLSVIQPECDNLIILNLTSQCACPGKCLSTTSDSSSGLSTGSILLIVFFTLLLAYLIVGITWKFCNGAAGIELLPNFEFWNELPTLIMDSGSSLDAVCRKYLKPNMYTGKTVWVTQPLELVAKCLPIAQEGVIFSCSCFQRPSAYVDI